jgi:hypothetical protein
VETVVRAAAASARGEWIDEIRPAVAWALAQQRADGSWPYGADPRDRWEDGFHTGFNLMSLVALRRAVQPLRIERDALVPSSVVARGACHYATTFFDASGRPRYYRDRAWPADTHAAAVGILATLDCTPFLTEGTALTERILDWSLAHLWDERGHFVFRRLPGLCVRIPYLRWSQAWMLRALAEWHTRQFEAAHDERPDLAGARA